MDPPTPPMQTRDTLLASPLAGANGRERLRVRLEGIRAEVPRVERERIEALLAEPERDLESLRDAVSTRLMEVFKGTRPRGPFGLLYELNASHLLVQVTARLRRYGSAADPLDVLQEVFFNVHRYPHRFDSTREDAFRVWSATIVRNTVLKHLRSQRRGGRQEVPFEDLSDHPTDGQPSPMQDAILAEDRERCAEVYVTYLSLYMGFYRMLGAREQRALHLVEVEGRSYRDAADELEIRLENLKMVIFRARRKIHRAMRRTFEGLPHDCKPAREPGSRSARPRTATAQNHLDPMGPEDAS